MNHFGDRFLSSGTILICPICKQEQATILVDIYPDKSWDWRAVKPIDDDGIIGISKCCNERYITFESLFWTDHGPI